VTGREHYNEAERLLAAIEREMTGATENTFHEAAESCAVFVAAAQVHATLALASAAAGESS